MNKLLAIGTLLLSSAAVLVTPAAALYRDNYVSPSYTNNVRVERRETRIERERRERLERLRREHERDWRYSHFDGGRY